MISDKTKIRSAATVIVVRSKHKNPSVLMGQRGVNAAFMPSKFVFPGGAVDDQDLSIDIKKSINEVCKKRLLKENENGSWSGLVAAAIRELFEETGQIIGVEEEWSEVPSNWEEFAKTGYVPDASNMSFVFRAITPPGRPRRFDARFFLIQAEELRTNLDDFSMASDELSHLQWIPLKDTKNFDLPFITQVVLAEVTGNLMKSGPPARVPFFQNTTEESLIYYINEDES
ncbi:NUDIX hydrolase [Paracoccaceae bacterium]|nr:NUDIX hydrolase [Paracoccaceae bacterium]